MTYEASAALVQESPELAERYADIHRVLANRRRLLILATLADRELSVTGIADAIGASLQSTSQHLHVLRKHAILCSRRVGHTVYYRLNDPENLPVPLWPALPPQEGHHDGPGPSSHAGGLP